MTPIGINGNGLMGSTVVVDKGKTVVKIEGAVAAVVHGDEITSDGGKVHEIRQHREAAVHDLTTTHPDCGTVEIKGVRFTANKEVAI